MKKIILIFLLALFVPVVMMAQVVVERSNEIITVGGVEYYMHHVKQGETLYSISKAYHVSIEEITRKNPEVNDGLQAEMVIGIPVVDIPEEESVPEKVEPVGNDVAPVGISPSDSACVVAKGETLFDIAKRYGIDLAAFKALNPGLTNEPAVGTVISIPSIRNEEEYIVHKAEVGEKTSTLLRKWKVDEDVFRSLNPSVGSHVFPDQVVLIPIEKIVYQEIRKPVEEEKEEAVEEPEPEIVVEPTPVVIEEELEPVPECDVLPQNAKEHYHVALLIPLYLNEIGNISLTPEGVSKSRKSKSMTFLPFYEGFKIAVDSLVNHYGLHLDLTVIDVTENTGTAQNAVDRLRNENLDMIVGPFFSKSFDVVQEYANSQGIVIVNPMSARESIVADKPFVVKVKPSASGQLLQLASLVNQYYGDSNVSILCQKSFAENSSDCLDEMERVLNLTINKKEVMTTDELRSYIRSEEKRMETEQVSSSSDDGENEMADSVRFEKMVGRYVYESSDLSIFNGNLSKTHDNLVIACGNSNVYATQMLNNLNKTAQHYPITLVAFSDWTGLDKLLVDNLLKVNAIYFSDAFVDYNSPEVKQFVCQFRKKYTVDPSEYAFCGFDVAWHFLNVLMRYGHNPKDCIPSFDETLLANPYHFVRTGSNNGLENTMWSIYQYDKERVELKPVWLDAFEEEKK